MMRYLLAILLPPVAVLSTWRPISAVLNCVLCLLFWVPGVLHAILCVADYNADERARLQRTATRKAAESRA